MNADVVGALMERQRYMVTALASHQLILEACSIKDVWAPVQHCLPSHDHRLSHDVTRAARSG